MIPLADLLAQGAPDPAALARHPEADVALRLLSGQRPKRIASSDQLMAWAGEAAGISPALLAACLKASGDKAEVAALLLPKTDMTPPTLREVLGALDRAAFLADEDRKALWLSLAAALPRAARILLNRLATGTFRTTLRPEAPPEGGSRSFRALLVMIAPQGPEASFALPHGNGLVPIARTPLTLPETPEILAWARKNITDRFGPNLAVTPQLVFTLTCDGTTPNARRKSGVELVAPRLLHWDRDATPDQATTLDAFRAPRFICS